MLGVEWFGGVVEDKARKASLSARAPNHDTFKSRHLLKVSFFDTFRKTLLSWLSVNRLLA